MAQLRLSATGLRGTGLGACELSIVDPARLATARPPDLRWHAEELHERGERNAKQPWTDLSSKQLLAVDPVEDGLVAHIENPRDVRGRVQRFLFEREVVDAWYRLRR